MVLKNVLRTCEGKQVFSAETNWWTNQTADFTPHVRTCPRCSDPFHLVSYYVKWVTTSWTHSTVQTCGNFWITQYISTMVKVEYTFRIDWSYKHYSFYAPWINGTIFCIINPWKSRRSTLWTFTGTLCRVRSQKSTYIYRTLNLPQPISGLDSYNKWNKLSIIYLYILCTILWVRPAMVFIIDGCCFHYAHTLSKSGI